MGRPLDAKSDGDALTPADLNRLYRELSRRRRMTGAGLVVEDAAGPGDPVVRTARRAVMLARLTGPYVTGPPAGYPWEEVSVGPGRVLTATGLTGSAASGDPAFERRTNDRTAAATGRVNEYVRSAASGQWLFPGAGTTTCAGTTLTVRLLGCNSLPLAHATVHFDGVGGVDDVATDAGGYAVLPVGRPGVYTYSGGMDTRFLSPGTTSVTMVCGVSRLFTQALTADYPNYICVPGCAEPVRATVVGQGFGAGPNGSPYNPLTWTGSEWFDWIYNNVSPGSHFGEVHMALDGTITVVVYGPLGHVTHVFPPVRHVCWPVFYGYDFPYGYGGAVTE